MKNIFDTKNFFLFFYNLKVAEEKKRGELHIFNMRRTTKFVVNELIVNGDTTVILLYRKKTKNCYYYCAEGMEWATEKEEITKNFKIHYEFEQKKEVKIKEFLPLENFIKAKVIEENEVKKNPKKQKRRWKKKKK